MYLLEVDCADDRSRLCLYYYDYDYSNYYERHCNCHFVLLILEKWFIFIHQICFHLLFLWDEHHSFLPVTI